MVSVLANLVMTLLKTRERSGHIVPTEVFKSVRFGRRLTSVQGKNFDEVVEISGAQHYGVSH